jgi:hypothetical protein
MVHVTVVMYFKTSIHNVPEYDRCSVEHLISKTESKGLVQNFYNMQLVQNTRIPCFPTQFDSVIKYDAMKYDL